jgi:acyl-CoA synthetase (AMP-forming)/AMP-acid ligase II
LLGHGVCEKIKSPIQDLDVVFVCPAPSAGERPVFWTPPHGMRRAELTSSKIEEGIEAAIARGSRPLALPAPDQTKTYHDLNLLRREAIAAEKGR